MDQKEITRKYYDEMGGSYLERAKAPASSDGAEIIKEFIRTLPEEYLVLDAGCGPLSILDGAISQRVVAIDNAESMIDYANSHESKNIECNNTLYKIGDIETFSSSSSFDVIAAKGVIEYLETDEELFRNAFRLLKDGGYLIVQFRNAGFKCGDPNYKNPMPMKRRVHTLDDVYESASRFGFVVSDVKYYHFHDGKQVPEAASAFIAIFRKVGE